MSTRLLVWLWLALLVPVAACGKSGGSLGVMPVTGGSGGGGADSSGAGAPEPSDAEWQTLRSLSPEALPGAVADISNKYADNAAAAALGQALFFDQGFSGPLLDADNDGGPNSLGKRGEAGRVSCAGCHMSQAAFADTRSTFQEISLGTGWTHRRTPSLLDIGQASIVMWAGRHSTLWSQPFGPFENPLEMNSSRLFVARRIATEYAAAYEKIFGKGSLGELATAKQFGTLTPQTTGCTLTKPIDRPRALPPDAAYECHGTPGDKAEYDALAAADQDLVTRTVVNYGKAVAAYERKLSCGQGRFDAWVAGDASALSPSERRGALLFVGKGKCVSCHSGPYLSDQQFHNVGLNVVPTKEGILNGNDDGAKVDLQAAHDDPVGILGPYSDGDDGRLPKKIDDKFLGAFRTPTLRCVAQRPSFMHTGTKHTLEEVVAFFSNGGDDKGFPGTSEAERLDLSPAELMDMVAFLKTLDGAGPDSALKSPTPAP